MEERSKFYETWAFFILQTDIYHREYGFLSLSFSSFMLIFSLFLNITKRLKEKICLMKQQFKGKISWHENIQLKALLKINGKSKIYKSDAGNLSRRILWMFCSSYSLSLSHLTNCFSSSNFLLFFFFTISLTIQEGSK